MKKLIHILMLMPCLAIAQLNQGSSDPFFRFRNREPITRPAGVFVAPTNAVITPFRFADPQIGRIRIGNLVPGGAGARRIAINAAIAGGVQKQAPAPQAAPARPVPVPFVGPLPQPQAAVPQALIEVLKFQNAQITEMQEKIEKIQESIKQEDEAVEDFEPIDDFQPFVPQPPEEPISQDDFNTLVQDFLVLEAMVVAIREQEQPFIIGNPLIPQTWEQPDVDVLEDGTANGQLLWWDDDENEWVATTDIPINPAVLVYDIVDSNKIVRWETIDSTYKGIYRGTNGNMNSDWLRASP